MQLTYIRGIEISYCNKPLIGGDLLGESGKIINFNDQMGKTNTNSYPWVSRFVEIVLRL
jgi:hypothetical protein